MTPQIPPNASSVPSALAKWYPKLDGLKLPDELIRGMRRAFDCIYQLRDYLAGTPTGIYSTAYANLTLTVTPALVPGLIFPLTRPGMWLITTHLEVLVDHLDAFIQLKLVIQGQTSPSAGMAIQDTVVGNSQQCMSQQWMIQSTTGSEQVSVQAFKLGGGGTSAILTRDSTLSAIWISP